MIKKLKQLFDDTEHHFEKGGKFERLYPLHEAGKSFHFSPETVTSLGANIRDFVDTKRYMILVVIALLPCMLFGIYNAGYQSLLVQNMPTDLISSFLLGLKIFLPMLLVTYAVGGAIEALFAIIRRHEINEGLLVTGMLFPLTLPPTIPLWQVGIGIAFGVIVAKEVFGGTGKNFLNVALTSRAFLYFSYPSFLSGDVWTLIGSKDKLIDSYTGATSLAVAAATPMGGNAIQALEQSGNSLSQLFWGLIPGSIGETSVFFILIGAVILLVTRIASWQIMAGSVAGLYGMTWILNWSSAGQIPFFAVPPEYHLMMGSFAFGAVFMATDPVSAPDLRLSKWIYGIGIGAFTVIIRVMNPAYPEGVMLAILLMNVFAPLIDYYVRENRLKKRVPNVI